MIILVSVVAQIGPKGSCAVHMNRPQPATSVGYSIYLKKNYRHFTHLWQACSRSFLRPIDRSMARIVVQNLYFAPVSLGL